MVNGTFTVNYEIRTACGTYHGEFYGFKTAAAAKAYVTREFNKTFGRNEWFPAKVWAFVETLGRPA
jgi:hypothetical protein